MTPLSFKGIHTQINGTSFKCYAWFNPDGSPKQETLNLTYVNLFLRIADQLRVDRENNPVAVRCTWLLHGAIMCRAAWVLPATSLELAFSKLSYTEICMISIVARKCHFKISQCVQKEPPPRHFHTLSFPSLFFLLPGCELSKTDCLFSVFTPLVFLCFVGVSGFYFLIDVLFFFPSLCTIHFFP